jgi:hypothetical protein
VTDGESAVPAHTVKSAARAPACQGFILEDDTRAPRSFIRSSISRIHFFEFTLAAKLRLTAQFTV